MLKLILLFLVICFVIGVLKAIFDALKDVLLGILGIGIIIAAVVFLGPLFLKALPWILVIGIGLLVLGGVISVYERQKYKIQLQELDWYGIEQISYAPEAVGRLEKWKLVETTASGYVISASFCRRLCNTLNGMPALREQEIIACCFQCARQFREIYHNQLIEYFQKKGFLVPFSASNGQVYYFPEGFLRRFEELLIREGAATKTEFSQVCKEAGLSAGIREKDDIVAEFILNNMASRQKAKKVELTELGECLYVSQKQRKDSKMTREEITLD